MALNNPVYFAFILEMSRESRQRLREEAKQREMRMARGRKFHWLLPLIAVAIIAVGAFVWNHFRSQSQKKLGIVAAQPAPFRTPRTLKELLALPPAQLDRCDIGLMNILCAERLPGAENLNVDACLKQLDDWAQQVKSETQRHEYRFNDHPDQFRNSLGYYRMMMLGTVLVQDLGIQYNPRLSLPQMDGKRPTLADGADSKNVFIHGLLEGKHLGTCASMPVLVAVIGRRLGYPVNLAGAKLHLYVRYEEPNGKHFNIEPTVTDVFLTPTDEDYKKGNDRFPATDDEIKGYSWLRPLSNREVLSDFLNTRAICLGDAKRYDEAEQTFLLSASFWKETPQRKKSLDYYLQILKDAPGGDKWETLWDEVGRLDVPQGTRSGYFDNRKAQIHYFMNDNTNLPAVAKTVDDLKIELAEYQSQIVSSDPDLMLYRQHILKVLRKKSGNIIRIPVEVLPPPLNRGTITPAYLDQLEPLHLEDMEAIIAEFWDYYKQTTPDWMEQASLLPSW
jgi:hypothetical protein